MMSCHAMRVSLSLCDLSSCLLAGSYCPYVFHFSPIPKHPVQTGLESSSSVTRFQLVFPSFFPLFSSLHLVSHLSSLLVNTASCPPFLCPYLPVLQSQQIVPEDLRPVLTEQVQLQSNRRVHHRLDSPAQAEPPSTSTRPAQVVLGCLFPH